MSLVAGLSFVGVLAWILVGSLQYGFHISALNSSQASIICENAPLPGARGLPSCIPMSPAQFGIITASFTLGGFFSSITAGKIADRFGRKKASVFGAIVLVFGSSALSGGSTVTSLAVGRFLIGLGCGVYTVLVPLFLSEVAPADVKGSIGVLTQLLICVGIFTAQLVSMPLSEPETGKWRYIPLISAGLAIAQIISSPKMIESPKWLSQREDSSRVFDVPTEGEDADSRIPILAGHSESVAPHTASLSLWEAFTSLDPDVKRGLRTVVVCQAFQQASGINAVMYYSTGILSTISPNAKYVSLFVTLINVIMTLPAMYFIDRLGRRSLLSNSLLFMSISSVILAYSINHSLFFLASIFIVLFVASFSIGLGPIPFLILGEIPPQHARAASASAALGFNWGLNLLVGLGFLPLRDWFSGGAPTGEGTIFYLFAVISLIGTVTTWSIIRG